MIIGFFYSTALITLTFSSICWAQLNVTNSTTFSELSSAIVDLGFNNLENYGILSSNTTTAASLNSTGTCATACSLISIALGNSTVAFPDSSAYAVGQTYWSNIQVDTKPTCHVVPTEPLEISAILLVLQFTQCQFAIKSGGHASFAGGSNIQDGITIDMKGFNAIELTQNNSVATVGPGNRWGDVVKTLESDAVTVTAGRVYDVGVGGLALGGGISFLSNRYGLVVDNTAAYHVVLADGSMIIASPDSHSDLYWALRGGGNNFGVVTAFDFYTYPLSPTCWAGFYGNPVNQSNKVFDAFENYVLNLQDTDLDSAFICTYAAGVMNNILTHATGVANASVFKEVLAIPSTYSTLATQTLSDFTTVMNSTGPYGYREIFITWSIKVNATLLQDCVNIFINETSALKASGVAMLEPAISFQSLGKGIIRNTYKNGGNPLGISNTNGALLVVNMGFEWYNATDDGRVRGTAEAILDQCSGLAKESGQFFDYIYQNYAISGQEVFKSYGESNLEKLKEISKRYDPGQVFQTLEPGYFKLGL